MLKMPSLPALLAAVLLAPALPAAAADQAWPTRAVRVIVPFSVGSSADIVCRTVTDQLSVLLGQPFVVENRGGAGGTIGAALVAKADAYPNAPYDTAKDFAAIANYGILPNVLIISPKKNIRTLKELIAAAKAREVSFATAGVASASHWAVERILIAGGIKAMHVPFKGGPELILEVATGRVDFGAPGVSSAMPFIKEGRLLPLAVSTTRRSASLPDVPTTAEAGLVDADYLYWNGLLAPSRTPREIIDRLYRETQKVLAMPAVRERMLQLGVEPLPMTSGEFDALIRKEIDVNIKLVKAAGLKFD